MAKEQYEHQGNYVGTMAAVGAVDFRGGHYVIPVMLQGPHGTIKGTLFLDQNDAKGDYKSSYDQTRELALWCGVKDFVPPFDGWAGSKQPVSFMVELSPDGKGGFYREARYIKPLRAIQARNPATEAQLSMLFARERPATQSSQGSDTGNDNPATQQEAQESGQQSIPGTEPVRARRVRPATAQTGSGEPGDDDIPF